MKKLCFATHNRHKLEEVGPLLRPGYQLVSLDDIGFKDELAEDFSTIQENSSQKAQFIYDHFGIDCFSDDTGLEVFTLNGEPGVYSARYAGPQKNSDDNIRLLLQKLGTSEQRKARFRTVITLILGKKIYQFEGILNGQIALEKKGEAGFGYDPVFVPDGFEVTLAEMSLEEKNRISHRAQATAKLIQFLAGLKMP